MNQWDQYMRDFSKRNFMSSVIIPWTYSTFWKIFKDFLHVIRTYITDIFKNCDKWTFGVFFDQQAANCFEIFFKNRCILSSFGEKRMHLFCVICGFRIFTLRLAYHAGHAWWKCGCTRAFFPVKKLRFSSIGSPDIVSSITQSR